MESPDIDNNEARLIQFSAKKERRKRKRGKRYRCRGRKNKSDRLSQKTYETLPERLNQLKQSFHLFPYGIEHLSFQQISETDSYLNAYFEQESEYDED